MSATVAAGLLATLASNAMADAKASAANEDERQNMFMQNMLNRRNNVLAYSDQVQGAKMAGLSPAMLNGATPNVAAPVTKANAHVAENVEIDPASLLLDAQAENLRAQTAKTEAETAKIEGVDTENTRADTQAKQAATYLTQAQTVTEGNKPGLVAAQTQNAEAEAQRIKNLNKAFAEEDSAMGLFGQTMAQNWQKEPWYDKLSKGSKMVIDDIAKGNMDLTVGIASALNKSIDTDQNMNQTEKNKFEYELTEKVIQAQMKDPKVMKALAKIPQAQYNELLQRASKLAAETKLLKFDYDWNVEKKDVWTKNDPDKLYAEYVKNPTVENAAKWLVASARATGSDAFRGVGSAAVAGSAAGRGAKSLSEPSFPSGSSYSSEDIRKASENALKNLNNYEVSKGVQNMFK